MIPLLFFFSLSLWERAGVRAFSFDLSYIPLTLSLSPKGRGNPKAQRH
jgi:hypothetical protein